MLVKGGQEPGLFAPLAVGLSFSNHASNHQALLVGTTIVSLRSSGLRPLAKRLKQLLSALPFWLAALTDGTIEGLIRAFASIIPRFLTLLFRVWWRRNLNKTTINRHDSYAPLVVMHAPGKMRA